MLMSFLEQNDDKLSRSIEGSLSLMTLSDLLQWIEVSRRSGTLMVANEELTKRFFFQDGRLIFLWSDKEDEQLCEALHQTTGLPLEVIHETLRSAEQLGISCVGYLSSEQGIPLERLIRLISTLSERAMADVITWKAGRFRFSDHLPLTVLSSPVTLPTTQVLMESAVLIDETDLAGKASTDSVLDEMFDLIRKGAINLPPLPTEMQQLMSRINNPNLMVDEIIDCVDDPILVSKVLRVCNSSFYGRRTNISTLREAVVYMGLKSLLSIVTVHALSGFSPRNAQQVQALLRHSMATGMIAKQLARDMGCNHDQAFVCGLLHDLGWIVMLELLAEYDLPAEKRDQMIMDHHSVVGGLVAKKWNLSEDIQEVIRHHHNPLNAVHYPKLVEVVHISDLLTKTDTPAPETAHSPLYSAMGDITAPFADRLEELDQEIDAILSPM